MNLDFNHALSFTLKWEGGFVNHAADPGGPTNKGITQVTYDQWRKTRGLETKPVKNISDKEVEEIYRHHYWAAVEGRTNPSWRQFRVCLFDTFVQFGVIGGTFLWQKVAGVHPDGQWGRRTSQATEGLISSRGVMWCALALVGERVRYRAQRVQQKGNQLVFLQGWLNRDTDLLLFLLDLR